MNNGLENKSKLELLRNSEENTLKDYLILIRQNLVPIILITITGLAVSIIYAINAQNIYQSSTALKIAKPQGSILSSPLMPEFNDWGNDRFIANEIEILKSYRLRETAAQTLIDTFNTKNNPELFYLLMTKDEAFSDGPKVLKTQYQIAKTLESAVKIDQKRGLDIVDISVESPSPYEAQLVANVYAKAYEQLNLLYNRTQLIAVKDFLTEQREEKLNQLVLAEEKVKKYREEGGIIALDEQASALIDQLTDFEAKKNATEIEMTIAKNALQQYREELNKQNPKINEYIENVAAQLRRENLQKEIASLETQKDVSLVSSGSSAKKDEIIAFYDKKISELKSKLDEQLKIYKASIYAASPEEIKQLSQKVLEEEIKFQSLSASFKELEKMVAEYEKRFNQLPERTLDLGRLEREKSAIEKLYLLVEEKYQEALINEQSTPGNVLIIDKARTPLSPSKPNRNLIIIMGLVLGLGLGVGFVFIRNYFDNSIQTPEDIQKMNISVLAWIPKIEGVDAAESKEFEFIVAKRPDSIPSEAFRALRTRIQYAKLGDNGNQLNTILITSSAPKEGKTTVATNIAGSLALTGQKTLLIDCDLRKPRLHAVVGAERSPGLTDYFFEKADYSDVIKKSDVENLYYITAGIIPPNPAEILGSRQMQGILNQLRNDFDKIIIDSPPIIAVTDSEILSRLVDGTILVVSANETESELMQKSVELLSHDHGTFVGTVLNNFSYKTGYGAYYKYYYYYSRPKESKSKRKKNKV